MDAQQFIKTILPSSGTHCVTLMLADKTVRKQVVAHGDIASYGQNSADSIKNPSGWYAAFTSLGSLSQGWYKDEATGKTRLNTAKNTAELKTLFLDIDVGLNGYETDIDAMADLFTFCGALNLPEPLIVGTGGGIHGYLPFYAPVPKARWLVLAEKLALVCAHFGLKVDTARTQDCASQPRLPNSMNLKYDPPRQVVIENDGELGSDIAIEGALDAYIALHGIKRQLANAPSESSGDKTGTVAAVVAGCAQVAQQQGAVHHVWRGMISILSYCEGGKELARGLSAQDPRHCDDAFDQKWDEFRESGHKPYTCASFNRFRPGLCGACPNHGRITSPIKLGYVGRPQPTNTDAPTFETLPLEAYDDYYAYAPVQATSQASAPQGGTEPNTDDVVVPETDQQPIRQVVEIAEPPEFYSNYYIIKNGASYSDFGVFVRVEVKKPHAVKGEPEAVVATATPEYEDVKIFNYVPVLKSHIVENHEGMSSYYVGIEFTSVDRITAEIEIPLNALTKAKLIEVLFTGGVLATPMQQQHITAFITGFIMQLKDKPYFTPVQSADCLGLSKDRSQFLLGHRAYRKGGSYVRYKPRKGLYSAGTATEPHGTLEGWKRIADLYNGPGMEWAQCVIAASIAAPLLSTWGFATDDDNGGSSIPFASVVVSLFGGSGDGKTGVQKVANSIWGHPTEMLGLKADTPLARFQHIGTYNNIPVQFDEMSGMDADEISNFAYQCTQGRPKNASTADGTKRKNELRWNTVITLSTNTSQIAILRDRGASEAQIRRIFELKTAPLAGVSKYNAAEADELLGNLRNHYGVVGHEVARVFMEDPIYHADALSTLYGDLYKHHKLDTKNRFYVMYIALVVYGCRLGRSLGVINYQTARLEQYLVARSLELSVAADEVVVADTNTSLLTLFRNQKQAECVTVFSHKRGTVGFNGADIRVPAKQYTLESDKGYVRGDLPRNEVSMRLCVADKLLYIPSITLKAWCDKNVKHGASYNKLIEQLKQEKDSNGLPRLVQERTSGGVNLGAGTSMYSRLGSSNCIVVSLDDDDEFIDE